MNLLSLYVELNVRHCFCDGSGRPLGEGFVKILGPQSILEGSYKHFLVHVDILDGHLIEPEEMLIQGFSRTLANIEKVSG